RIPADITDGTSQTLLVGERSFAYAKGTWTGAISSGVIQRGVQNPCPGSAASTAVAPALVLAHSHLINTDTDTDGGLDDFASFHPGGANFLFGDGSVRFLKSIKDDGPGGALTPDGVLFTALGTRNGGEVVTGLE